MENRLVATPPGLDFGAVAAGDSASLPLVLKNVGWTTHTISRVRFLLGASGNGLAFTLTLDGQTYAGGSGDTSQNVVPVIQLRPGQEIQASVEFAPTEEQFDALTLRFEGSTSAGVALSGLGGHEGDPYMHAVIDGQRWAVDYDGSGSEGFVLDGSGSHTHEPGRSIVGYEWRIDGSPVSNEVLLSTSLPLGPATITLEISDDGTPPRHLETDTDFEVVATSDVPGVLARYYDASAAGPLFLLDSVPSVADYAEQRGSFALTGVGQVGGSPFEQDVLVQLTSRVLVTVAGQYTFNATGGTETRVRVDGAVVSGPIALSIGEHELDARYAVEVLADLPLDLFMAFSGGSSGPIDSQLLRHDQSTLAPVINSMTETGASAGGTPVTIDGMFFFPAGNVLVHWAGTTLDASDFTGLSPTRIELLAPPGGGAILVQVENGNGTSNLRTFTYEQSGPIPIQFRRDLSMNVPAPTAGVYGPDGKLYVASLDGRITAIEFNADYNVVSSSIHGGVSGLSNYETLGLAVNPYDPPSPVKLYVAHGDLFVNGGTTPTGPSPYTGQISVLTGPGFNAPVPLITGLPVSNHDHGVNGIVFDNNGDLLISVGSMTNAGVAHPHSGDLPESPLSASVLKAWLSRPGFDGALGYVNTVGGAPNNDQRYGESVDVVPGIDVELHATGLRNAYGLVYTTKRRLYATDNGPNSGFGAASTGPTTEDPDPTCDDELILVEWGNYYGHPNRSRGRTDPRQNVYYLGIGGPPSIADVFTQMNGWLPASSDGLDEYRSDTFGGQMRGDLIVQEYQNKLRRVRLKADGRGLLGQFQLDPNTGGVSCVVGPGGAIISFDYLNSQIEVLEPEDVTPVDFIVHDIYPWRAPASGGTPFTISGRGFGTLASTSVLIGGRPATLTSVSWSRIKGLIPAEASPTTALVDVTVSVGAQSDTLPQAFRFLLGPGLEPGRWETLANVPAALGEVAAGTIEGVLYLVGEGTSATYAYDLLNRQWLSNKAARPFVGDHHAAEVVGGKLYLIGGLDGGSEGRVQIYDPATNSWSQGASMSWAAGSVSTAVIGGKIYAAGGIVSTFTVGNCAVYDPVLNTWTALAPMPDGGRNHAAAATDGTKLYVFGGRKGGNFVANGYDSVMIYTPGSPGSWTWSGAGGSTLAKLPEARGGMGKAIYHRGEFYVFGGETLNDPDAGPNGVYDRVDVYDPVANTWRAEAKMINPRHGLFPVLFQGHIFLAGGGTQSGFSQSNLFDEFTRQ
jgi:N-acetylneuraminic acid mutarotase